MVNHFRTLLACQDGSTPFGDSVGELYVPPAYVVPSLSRAAREAFVILFGDGPDRDMFNYRMTQILNAVHGSPFEAYIYRFDDRGTTYDSKKLTAFWTHPFGIDIVNKSGNGPIYVNGTPDETTRDSHMIREWRVRLTAKAISTCTLLMNSIRPEPASNSETVSVTNGLSTATALPKSTLTVSINPGSSSVGDEWRITQRLKPARDLPQVARDCSAAIVDQLSGGNVVDEPWRTYRNLANDKRFDFRIVGVALALQEHIENLRKANA